jgi:hypothetical protein
MLDLPSPPLAGIDPAVRLLGPYAGYPAAEDAPERRGVIAANLGEDGRPAAAD